MDLSPAGKRNGWYAGEVCTDGEEVAEVHLQIGSSILSPIGKAGVGVTLAQADRSHLCEGGVIVSLDQAANLEGLIVVLVRVAFTQGVGADHDSTLDLCAPNPSARLLQ